MDKVCLVLATSTTLIILYLSLIPNLKLATIDLIPTDKLYHFIAYAFLSTTWFSYALFVKNKEQNTLFNGIAIALIVFGIVVEVLQENFTDNRTFDWWDILSNSAGILIVYFFFRKNKVKLGKLIHQLNV